MKAAEAQTQVSDYWTRRAPAFDGVASHVAQAALWRDVLAAAFEAQEPKDVFDLGTGTGACALIAASLGHRVRACDGSEGMLAAARQGHTYFVANLAETMPGDFTRSADFSLPVGRLRKAIREAAGEDRSFFVDANRAAAKLFGSSLGANVFLLGFACQLGSLPVSIRASWPESSNGRPSGSCTRKLSIAMPSRVVWMRASMMLPPAAWIAPAMR